MNKRERVLAVLNGQPVDHIPGSFWFHFINKADTIGEGSVQAHLKYYRDTDVDFLKIMSDGLGYPLKVRIDSVQDWYNVKPLPKDDPFFTADGDDNSGDFAAFDAPAATDDSNPFGDFGAATDDANPFASAVETPGDAFGGFGGNDDGGFGGGSFDSSSSDAGFGGDAEVAPVAARAPQTEYAGKDFIFLVPCFLFLLLATIGAYELCRTIWSYEECSFDITGPVLDMIANAVGLTK